ncbi:MAG: hypothetical protein AAB576_01560 [Elusimicrobiota bacterium]
MPVSEGLLAQFKAKALDERRRDREWARERRRLRVHEDGDQEAV